MTPEFTEDEWIRVRAYTFDKDLPELFDLFESDDEE